MNFYAKFAHNYANETIPLLRLLNGGTKWKRGAEQQCAFEEIKQLFTTNNILAHPDLNKGYILTTDASEYAIGAALSQLNDNN